MEQASMYLLHVQKEKQLILIHRRPRKMFHLKPQEFCNLQLLWNLHMLSDRIRFRYLGKQLVTHPVSSWTYNGVPTGCLSHISKDDTGLANNYSSSSNESTPRVWASDSTQGNLKVEQYNTARVMPDFAQVYHFIGSVFDPCASDHLQRLKKMEPINVETVDSVFLIPSESEGENNAELIHENMELNMLSCPMYSSAAATLVMCNLGSSKVLMLMKNLAVNLVNPEFEDHPSFSVVNE
ncbi:UNVERIFIED_CONTAM: protein REVEILLE 6 [Sesamum radiatum]|uniref:Protein REVEILLE 6 n=1 Tax=Sesamum radiatum TaxID=300843 RepID=A0AAW2R254_SESRA